MEDNAPADQAPNQETGGVVNKSESSTDVHDQQQQQPDGQEEGETGGGESTSPPETNLEQTAETSTTEPPPPPEAQEVTPAPDKSEESSSGTDSAQAPPPSSSTEVIGETSAPPQGDTSPPGNTTSAPDQQNTRDKPETSDVLETHTGDVQTSASDTSTSRPKTSDAPPQTTSTAPPASSDQPKTAASSNSEVEGGESDRRGEGGEGGPGANEGSSSSGRRGSTREKRSRRKSRKTPTTDSSGGAVPGLRRRSSRVDSRGGTRLSTISAAGGPGGTGGGRKYLEVVILSTFQSADPGGSGYVQESVFWELLQSPALNLQLNLTELTQLQGLIQPDQSGFVPYAEFAGRSTDIIASLYNNQPPLEAHWVELNTADGSVAVYYNKQTGEVMEKAEAGIDVFAGVIDELHKRTDSDKRGYVNWKMFSHLLQSAEMSPFLTERDVKDMKEQFNSLVSNGKATYEQFYILAKELLLKVYRAKDPSDSPWCKISSQEIGEVWFNKFSGETHRGLQTGDSREHEIAFINEAYAHVEEVNYELEQYKQQCRILENQLAKSTEEQETLAAQLYDTGNALDEANSEIIRKENELDQMKAIIASKDQEADFLRAKLADMETVRMRMVETEQELQAARDTIANRDSSITERDTNIMTLQRQAEAATDELKTAHGEMDARDSTLAKLKHQLETEQKKIKEFEKSVPELEGKLSATSEQLQDTKHTLDEKMSVLGQTRKHLKNARERNMFLEKEMEKLEQTHDKLCSSESEIRTLKTFLTTKTALIEKHKKELKEVRLRVAELEEKDSRRAVILADVLEKTARQYQQQLGKPPASGGGLSPRGKRLGVGADVRPLELEEPRPYSAPAVPPEGKTVQWTEETDYHAPTRVAKTFTTDTTGPILTHSRTTGVGAGGARGTRHSKIKNRSRSVPKLPPIVKAAVKQQRTKSFIFPTTNDLRRENRLRDAMPVDHTASNPYCQCELCRMSATVVGHTSSHRPETGLTGMTAKSAGLPGYHGETDVRELALAEQLQLGQRVLVRMKKSEYDLEPTKLTGIIKYVGKVDSEYVDHRIYVGVKLDEAVGDTDGLVKNKRYFTCPAKHGKIVRISNVVAVLPHKSVFYKSLQEISKRSPYTTVQKKLSAQA